MKAKLRKLGVWIVVLSTLSGWAVVFGALAFGCWVAAVPFPEVWLQTSGEGSTRLLDRDGKPLRDVLDRDEGRSIWVERANISEHLVQATLAGEDHRYLQHNGVDPWAVLRAIHLNVSKGRIYSGASTLTMQLVRILDPAPRPRTVAAKFREAVLALRLERRLSKEEIIVQYLNRAPYGNGTRGVEAASRLYLGKSAKTLTLAEAALLASLPRSPSGYNPYRRFSRALKRQNHILGLMHKRNVTQQAQHTEAITATIDIQPRDYPFEAPHFVDYVIQHQPEVKHEHPLSLTTTLDLGLHRQVEALVKHHLDALKNSGIEQAAVVVIDNPTGEVLSLVGSKDWKDSAAKGQFNGATALRHPGMTLAPLMYTLAFESGQTPAQVYPDLPESFVINAHERMWSSNDDGHYRGPVRLREALSVGLKGPTFHMLRGLDGQWAWERLKEMELTHLPRPWHGWAPSLMARNARVSLVELTGAYAALARGGEWRAPSFVRQLDYVDGHEKSWTPAPRNVFGETETALVTDILSDEQLREMAHGRDSPLLLDYPVAALTTSDGHNGDFWALGYTPQITIGVWMGRFDGRPLLELTGLVDPGPLFRDIMEVAMADREPELFREPALEAVSICRLSGHKASEDCPHAIEEKFAEGEAPHTTCRWHMSISIDQRNGYRAGAGCADEVVENMTYVALPDVYRSWAHGQGLENLPISYSPECPVTGEFHQTRSEGWNATLLVPEPLMPVHTMLVHNPDQF